MTFVSRVFLVGVLLVMVFGFFLMVITIVLFVGWFVFVCNFELARFSSALFSAL